MLVAKSRVILSQRPRAASYVGPGDIVASGSAWGSCARAYSAAFAASRGAMMDLVDQAGANTVTINCLSTGIVDRKAIAAWVTAKAVSTILVTKLYDQSGTGNHFTQVTLANMPTLQLNQLNGLPALLYTSASGAIALATSALTFNQPFSMSCVYKRTSNTANVATVLAGAGSSVGTGPGTSGLAEIAAPGALTVATTEGVFTAVNGVFNNTSSAVMANSTAATGTSGASNITAVTLRIGRSTGGSTIDGQVPEAGIWGSLAFTALQYGNLDANQRNAILGYGF